MTDRRFPALGDIDDYLDMMKYARGGQSNPCTTCEHRERCGYRSTAVVQCSFRPWSGDGVTYADGYGPPEVCPVCAGSGILASKPCPRCVSWNGSDETHTCAREKPTT